MKNIPMFTTEYGVAGLTLQEIPYTGNAFVTVHSASDPDALIKECREFCVAVGANRVYACNIALETVALEIWEMVLDERLLPENDVVLSPLTAEILEDFAVLYNRKMASLPMASYLTKQKSQELLKKGSGFYVYRGNKLQGIGVAEGSKIEAVASVTPGGGENVVKALCGHLQYPASLEVASVNHKAITLYESLGFRKTKLRNIWYEIL